MPNCRLLIVGSANIDLVFSCEHLPSAGETLLVKSFAVHPGGKGANQAVAAAKLGAGVSFLGCVGEDSYGALLRTSLESVDVDCSYLQLSKGTNSGLASICVDASGANSIVVAPGANGCLTPTLVGNAIEVLRPDVVLAQLEIPMNCVEACSSAERFILNPAPARQLPRDLLSRCYAITPNETEAEMLTGIYPRSGDDCLRAATALLESGVQHVVITLGERGCFWASADGSMHLEAPSVEVVDTTAAGDAFNGALAMCLASGKSMQASLQVANWVGALSTTRAGAQDSMPNLAEVRKVAGDLL